MDGARVTPPQSSQPRRPAGDRMLAPLLLPVLPLRPPPPRFGPAHFLTRRPACRCGLTATPSTLWGLGEDQTPPPAPRRKSTIRWDVFPWRSGTLRSKRLDGLNADDTKTSAPSERGVRPESWGDPNAPQTSKKKQKKHPPLGQRDVGVAPVCLHNQRKS